jgi:hypothetical protein
MGCVRHACQLRSAKNVLVATLEGNKISADGQIILKYDRLSWTGFIR